ncbi:aminodeoxychorismate synthase component I [Virgibacillus xinjiangensis]|uniref:Aminodeoxychorismate synthase component I n=1 Tax=Virgibacillus xinjiangensis TaxID=393090 RepID=A0ABV7CV95_9BACI
MNPGNPFLLFDFETKKGSKSPYVFQDPVRVYQTNALREITTIFSKVEEAVDKGYYVAGCVSYEAAPAFDPTLSIHSQSDFPLVWFAVFEGPTNIEIQAPDEPYHVTKWAYDSSYSQYQSAITKIKEAIEKGNTYQINYTSRLQAQFFGNDFSFYQQLARNQQASYSAYLNIGRFRVLSASPELFFRVEDNRITTKPMKGTAKRGRYPTEDRFFKEKLNQSKKDQAENLMIVDLIRNDIGRIAVPGSVRVPDLFAVESYPTVHQMTSTIEAELEEHTTIYDWFQALFPSGSITGAPKMSTMDYIAQLEQSPRDVYCGAIGYITPNREATFNVPIRTVLLDTNHNKATYGVGGGITWDSTVDGEYEEMATKAQLLSERHPEFQLLESLALVNGDYPLLKEHLNRLINSACYFNFIINEKDITNHLEQLRSTLSDGRYKVRLLINRFGETSIESSPLASTQEPVTCSLAKSPIDSRDPYLYHKTTNRAIYEKHQKQGADENFSVLLWNEQSEITEFTTGNVVVKLGSKYYTPPVVCGLLGGTYRKQLLDQGIIEEKRIRKEDLGVYEEVWFINGVRGWLRVDMTLT